MFQNFLPELEVKLCPVDLEVQEGPGTEKGPGLEHRPLECRGQRRRHCEQCAYGDAAGAVAEYGDRVGVAAKILDIFLDPIQN
jgi:hypothetical protein